MDFSKPLTSDNFSIYAVKAYNNPESSGVKELNADLKTFKYLNVQIKKYLNGKTDNTRIILNYVLIIRNLFGVYESTRLLFFYFPNNVHPTLKSILNYFGEYPQKIPEADIDNIDTDRTMDKLIAGLGR